MRLAGLMRPATLAIVFLAGATKLDGQNLIRNGNFESFAGNEPKFWNTTNIPKILDVVTPVTRSHGGKYAVKCEVKDFHGSKMPGMITQKDIAISATALQFKGYYVLNSVGKDEGFISIELQDDEGNTVKICQENLAGPAPAFTQFSMAGDVPPRAVKLDIKMTLLPGKGSENLHEGSYILLDDLELVPVKQEGH